MKQLVIETVNPVGDVVNSLSMMIGDDMAEERVYITIDGCKYRYDIRTNKMTNVMTDVKSRIRSGWWYEPTMNMLKGYTQTIDEPLEIEYVKNVGLGTPVFEVDRLLSILLRTAWPPGKLINGLPTWRYELTVGPDHWLLLTVESEDGERVARFNAKIMNNND